MIVVMDEKGKLWIPMFGVEFGGAERASVAAKTDQDYLDYQQRIGFLHAFARAAVKQRWVPQLEILAKGGVPQYDPNADKNIFSEVGGRLRPYCSSKREN